MAHLDQKRSHSRVDVYMKFLKDYTGKHIFQLDDKDVLNFLVFKDVNDSGKTVVHHRSCPNLGIANIKDCSDKDLCSKRHTANSMRIGIVQKLRKGFEEVGRRGPFVPSTCEGDPTNSVLVNEYIAFKHREQGEAGVAPKSARTMYRFKMDLLMENMRLTIKGKRGILKLRLSERRAMYAYCFSAIKRLAGAGHVVSTNTYRMPNNAGLVFNCTWDKTLRMNTHCFGFKCVKNAEVWCAHCIIDEWVSLAKSFGFTFDRGLLFPRLNTDGTINHEKRWTSKDLTDSLKRDLQRYHLFQGETPHSFRHGGTVDSLKKGKSLERTMYLAYMKNKSTAAIYSKGLRVLCTSGFQWEDAGIDVQEVQPEQLSLQMQSWKAFY